jgi:hypothetical protein
MTNTIISREQEIYSFMNRSFFPPWKVLDTSEKLSEKISCFFMNEYQENTVSRSSQQKAQEHPQEKPKPQETKSEALQEKDTKLDWRYWAFWSAWLPFHGLDEYHKIPETKKLAFMIEEKTKMSDWFQENFVIAKKEIGKHWDRITNLEMEDAITGLITDIDESESGLKTLLICWTYYSMTSEKGALECIWIVPGKSLYYSFSHGLIGETETESEREKWGVFMEILEKPKNPNRELKPINGAPTRKPLKPQRRFSFRELEKGEVESIRESMVEIKSVNRSLAAISKYTLKDLMEIGGKLGLRPPMVSVLNEKIITKLDFVEKALEAEKELGVIRKTDKTDKTDKPQKSTEKRELEKWKKQDWYERLEEYCSQVF